MEGLPQACGPVLGGQPSPSHRRWGSSPPRAPLSSPGGPGARLTGKRIRGFPLVPSTVLVSLSSAGVLLLQNQPHAHLSSGALPSSGLPFLPQPCLLVGACRHAPRRQGRPPSLPGKLGAPERGLPGSSSAASQPLLSPSHPTVPLKPPSLSTCFHLIAKATAFFFLYSFTECLLYARLGAGDLGQGSANRGRLTHHLIL